jgi:hypothetical protein
MELSRERQIELSLRRFEGVLASMHDEAARFFSAPAAVRHVSELFSGAGAIRDDFFAACRNAKFNLQEARRLFAQKRYLSALRFMKDAGEALQQADQRWNAYVATSARGAKRVMAGLGAIAAGAAVALTGGAAAYALGGVTLAFGVGAAVGVHSAGGTLLFLLQSDSPSAGAPPYPALDVDALIPKIPDEAIVAQRGGAELIREAEQRLLDWREQRTRTNQPSMSPKGLGTFFIEVEALGAAETTLTFLSSDLKVRWQDEVQRLVPSVQGKEARDALIALMQQLFANHLQLYVAKDARICDFLLGGGGNCEAQTKLILSAIAAARLSPPPGQIFAVQIYADHVQLVTYDPRRDEVWELFSGRRVKGLEAPLYDPHVLYAAFLKGQEVVPPVSDDELLIAPANRETVGPGKRQLPVTNSTLQFPAGTGLYGNAPIAEEAYIASPYPDRKTRRDAPACAAHVTGRPLEDAGDVGGAGKSIGEWMEQHDLDFVVEGNTNTFVFRTEAQAKYFNALQTVDAKRNFLVQLACQSIARTFELIPDPPPFKMISSPFATAPYAARKIEWATSALHRYLESLVIDASSMIRRLYGELPLEGRRRLERDIEQQIVAQSPLLTSIKQRLSSLREEIARRPLEVIRHIDGLSQRQREATLLLWSVGADDAERERYEQALDRFLVDPKAVEVALMPDPSAMRVDVDLVGDVPGGTAPSPSTLGADGADARPIRISSSCMIDFMLAGRYVRTWGESTPTDIVWFNERRLSRWTSEITQEFMRLDPEGVNDGIFRNVYQHIVIQRPPESLTESDRTHPTRLRWKVDPRTGRPWRIPKDIAALLDNIYSRNPIGTRPRRR